MKIYKTKDELITDLKSNCKWHPSYTTFTNDEEPFNVAINLICPIYADCHIYGYCVKVYDGFVFVPFRSDI